MGETALTRCRAMRRLLTATAAAAAAAAALLAGPAMAQGNPYQLGMEYCGMIKNGISRDKAWDYLVSSYVKRSPSALNSGDPYAPWSPMNTFGGAIGSGITAGISAGIELRAMKSDIQAVVNANCPEGAEYTAEATETTQPQTVPASNPTTHGDYTNEGGIGIGFEGKDCPNKKTCNSYWIAAFAEGGPAQLDGRMRVGDRILEVDNQPAKGKTPNEIRDLIGGKVGTYVVILIEASGKAAPVTLKRVATSTLKRISK